MFALEAPGYARWCGHATDDEPWYLARVTTVAIFGYVALQLAIGVWVGRRVRTEDDYLVAGRSLGPIMTTFTVFATWFGAETCVGAAGIAYERGLAGNAADPFGYGIAVVLVGAFLAARLYGLRITTIADLLRTRYGADVEKLAALLMIPTSLLWAAAQIRAFGQILGGATGLEVPLAITIAAAVVLTYTSFGGMLADAYTDLVQGTVLLIGLGVVGFVLLPGADVAAIEPSVCASSIRTPPCSRRWSRGRCRSSARSSPKSSSRGCSPRDPPRSRVAPPWAQACSTSRWA